MYELDNAYRERVSKLRGLLVDALNEDATGAIYALEISGSLCWEARKIWDRQHPLRQSPETNAQLRRAVQDWFWHPTAAMKYWMRDLKGANDRADLADLPGVQ
jgi:hypothetical protein